MILTFCPSQILNDLHGSHFMKTILSVVNTKLVNLACKYSRTEKITGVKNHLSWS